MIWYAFEAWLFGVLGEGLLFSFASLAAWRVPRGQSIVSPPSFCPACEKPLLWRDLVPVLSWLWLRGRCRTCKAWIPMRELVVEMLGMAVGAVLVANFGFSPSALFYGLVAAWLLVIALVDLERYEVPLQVVIALALLWGIAALYRWRHGWIVLARSPLEGIGVMLLASLFAAVVTRGRYGGGDWLIGMLMGLFLGPYMGLVAWFAANLLAVPLALAWRAAKADGHMVPFGPALAASTVLFCLPAMQLWWMRFFPYRFLS